MEKNIKIELRKKLNENADMLMEKYFNRNIEVMKGYMQYDNNHFEFIQDSMSFSNVEEHCLLVFYYAFLTRHYNEESRKQVGFYDHPLINKLILDCINKYPYIKLRYCCDMNNDQLLEELGYDSNDDDIWRTMMRIRYQQIDEAIHLTKILNDVQDAFEHVIRYEHDYHKSLLTSLDYACFPYEIKYIFKDLGYQYVEEIKADSTFKTKLKHYLLKNPLSIRDEIMLSLCLDYMNEKIKINKLLYMSEDIYDFMIEHDLHNSDELFNHSDYYEFFNKRIWDIEAQHKPITQYDLSNITASSIDRKLLSNDIFKAMKVKLNIRDIKEACIFHHQNDDYMLIKAKSYHLFIMDKGQLIKVNIAKELLKHILANLNYCCDDLYTYYVIYEYCKYYEKTYSKLKSFITYLRKEKEIHKLDHLIERYVDDPNKVGFFMSQDITTLKDVVKAYLPNHFKTVDEVINGKDKFLLYAFDISWLNLTSE